MCYTNLPIAATIGEAMRVSELSSSHLGLLQRETLGVETELAHRRREVPEDVLDAALVRKRI